MNIYVLVEVTYDYYRFQENLAAVIAGNMDEALLLLGPSIEAGQDRWSIRMYVKTEYYDEREEHHLWIQEFKGEASAHITTFPKQF